MLYVLLLGCCIHLVLVLLIKAGDTDHVFNFFTNIEPTLVGGRECASLILKVHFFHWVLGKLAVL